VFEPSSSSDVGLLTTSAARHRGSKLDLRVGGWTDAFDKLREVVG
jgi:hypothetical protein